MGRTVLDIYAALVCFVSVVCLAFGAGTIMYGALGIAYPEVTLNPMSIPPAELPTPAEMEASRPGVPILPTLTEEERAKRPALRTATAIANERKSSLQSVIRWAIACLISAVLFVTHWRVLRRGKPGEN